MSSGGQSKRQQARNEKMLQELIKGVPGNSVCADCGARNPGWASWSLGIFLCVRCASVHRKLGTHITKVKSLSMDAWSNEQVETMRRMGNVASNRIYNPQNARPPIPVDADEAEMAIERFIKQKYQDRSIKAPKRHDTGSTNSDDNPPPLPPKTGSRFGFRSASSIFPLSSKARKEAAARNVPEPRSPEPARRRFPSPRRNKPSRVFGTAVGSEGSADLDSKLSKLRDMGFTDETRNLAVLKGLSGNLEKSIETLVRLGDGKPTPELKSGEFSGPSSRSRTPITPTPGLTIDRTRPAVSTKVSNNPFDMLDAPSPAQPQSSQSTGSQPHRQMSLNNPYQQTPSPNPFGLAPSQSQYALNQAFQNMSVSAQPSQPLFPNHTGGFPGPQQPQHQQIYQQSMTPPVPNNQSQFYPPVIYENQVQQPQQIQQPTSYNPFMQQMQQPQPIQTNFSTNPYNQQQATPQNLFQSPVEQSPAQQYPSYYDNGSQQQQQQIQPQQQQSNPYLSQQQQSQQNINPFFQQNQTQQPQLASQQFDYQSQQQPQYQQYHQQTHPILPQQTGRADKRSILDLYNYPQMAPTPQQPLQPQQQVQVAEQTPAPQVQQQVPQQGRSVSSPISATGYGGSKNPFAQSPVTTSQYAPQNGDLLGNLGQGPAIQNGSALVNGVRNGTGHMSQESMSVDTSSWANGRHSPDAWGSISARSGR